MMVILTTSSARTAANNYVTCAIKVRVQSAIMTLVDPYRHQHLITVCVMVHFHRSKTS